LTIILTEQFLPSIAIEKEKNILFFNLIQKYNFVYFSLKKIIKNTYHIIA